MSEEKVSFNEAQIANFTSQQMSEPKSSMGIYELPAGYLTPEGELVTEVVVKELDGTAEDLLASNIPGGKKFTQLLAYCVERLGTIVDKAQLLQAMRALTVGDRVFLMLALRRTALGDEYPYEAQCTNERCNQKSVYLVNLAELAIKKMPNPKQRVYDVVLPSKKTARYHVMNGADEETLGKLSPQDSLSLAILKRLDMVDDKPADLDAVKSLGLKDRNFLRRAFNQQEGGVNTTLELQCAHCGTDFKTEMDPTQTGFFYPEQVPQS